MKWIEALKEWNKTQPKWSIPKKGTAGYMAVKKILAGESVAKAPTKKPAKKTKPAKNSKPVKKSKPAPIETFEELFEEVAPVKRKVGRPRKS